MRPLELRRSHAGRCNASARADSSGVRVLAAACIMSVGRCSGLLLFSALLVATAPSAASKDRGPSCSDPPVIKTGQHGSAQASNAQSHHPPPHGIRIKWHPSISPKHTVVGYRVSRRESDSTCNKATGTCDFEPLNPTNPIVGTTCIDYDVQPHHTYTYQAQTVGSSGKVSVTSNYATATAK